jgi:hypothetical protein
LLVVVVLEALLEDLVLVLVVVEQVVSEQAQHCQLHPEQQ